MKSQAERTREYRGLKIAEGYKIKQFQLSPAASAALEYLSVYMGASATKVVEQLLIGARERFVS